MNIGSNSERTPVVGHSAIRGGKERRSRRKKLAKVGKMEMEAPDSSFRERMGEGGRGGGKEEKLFFTTLSHTGGFLMAFPSLFAHAPNWCTTVVVLNTLPLTRIQWQPLSKSAKGGRGLISTSARMAQWNSDTVTKQAEGLLLQMAVVY